VKASHSVSMLAIQSNKR